MAVPSDSIPKSRFHNRPHSSSPRRLWLLSSIIPFLIIVPAHAAPANALRPASIAALPLPTATLAVTTEYTVELPALQTTSTDAAPATEGIIISTLDRHGHPPLQPFPTDVQDLDTSTMPIFTADPEPLQTPISDTTRPSSINIFDAPIATDSPSSPFAPRTDHPVQPVGIAARPGPLQTNKFYANFLLGAQDQTIWPHPYSLFWAKNNSVRGGVSASWGLSVSHIERDALVYGDPIEEGEPPKYFAAPLYVQSFVLSATELGHDTVMTTDGHEQFSVNVNLAVDKAAVPLIRFPVVQGMGFVTGMYIDATPLFQSSVIFTTLAEAGTVNDGVTYKWEVKLKDGTLWLLYITLNGATGRPPLVLVDGAIRSLAPISGLVQIAKYTAGECGADVYDAAAGRFVTSATLSGSVEGKAGTYTFHYETAGSQNQDSLVFVLPHHVDSMDDATRDAETCVQMWTTTKGLATAFNTDTLTYIEDDLPTDILFDPWTPQGGSLASVNEEAALAIEAAAMEEIAEDIGKNSNLDSAYYAGKALSRYSLTLLALTRLGTNPPLASLGLSALESALHRWTTNNQTHPFAYDSIWGGIVSTASYDGRDPGLDFGSTLYNDHHFHYGYFVHAASVVAYLRPAWLDENDGANARWVQALIRDFANPAGDMDPWFPASRAFDWWNGHSWATGVFAVADGKSEESTSEDAFAHYAVKLWGIVTHDASMEARANLQLAVLKRAFGRYFYYADGEANTIQPARFTPHLVSGILFENKIDHTTYFGQAAEYVQGIHMLPFSPVSAYMRPAALVAAEWARYFQSTIPPYAMPNAATNVIDAVGAYPGGHNCSEKMGWGRLINCVSGEGWRGVLMANAASLEPRLAWGFWKGDKEIAGEGGFEGRWAYMVGRTWGLACAAAFGGAGD